MDRSVARIEAAAQPQRSSATHANRFVITPQAFAEHSPFLMLMEDWFAPPAGFPDHPHRGMETVTLVLEGSLEHRDHTGAHGVLGPGDVQWMTAGKGVVHSEMPGPGGVHSLQLWLNLPAARKMSEARYADQHGEDAPVVSGDGWSARVYAGRQGGADRPHGSSHPMSLLELKVDAGATAEIELPADQRAFLYALEGSAHVGAEKALLAAGRTAWFDPSAASTSADVIRIAADAAFRALLYAGPPIDEPVVAYGPFVMNTEDEIRQAFDDYRRGQFV